MLWVWSSLAVALVAVAGSVAFVVVRTLEAWRGFRGFSAALGEASTTLTARADAVAAKAGTLGGDATRTTASLERLARSQARMAVLTAAIGDVQAAVARVTGIVPRK